MVYLPLKLSVTEDGITYYTSQTIKKFSCGIGSSFTLHLIMMYFQYIDENKSQRQIFCLTFGGPS